jgi:hypothetical protein
MGPVLAVHEAQDEPLLCTVQRFWWFGTWWDVRDADELRVAQVFPDRITDRWSRLLALRRRGLGSSATWVGPVGGELATVLPGPDGLRVRFVDAIADRPLTKMALLAAALVREAGSAPP